MNSISVLQTAASLDSETVFRRMLENGLSTSTESLLDWEAFAPDYFGIETPRHSKIFAKKIVLPYYALLSDDVQEATLEKIAKQIETDHSLFIAYETHASAGIISVYIASHKVDSETLIELLDDEDDSIGFPPAQEDDEDEHLTDPEILIGSDVLVNGELHGVLEIREDDETGEFFATLDDESEIEVAGIYLDPEGRYVYGEDLDDDEDDADDIDPNADLNSSLESDDDDDDDDDSFEDEQPSNQNPETSEIPESDESEFEVESPTADVLVPQIRETEETENGDDDFPEEALVDSEQDKPEVTEDEALAQAVAEEQAAQQEQPIDWTRPPIEPVDESKAASSDDSTFAEEAPSEEPKAAENAAAAPVEASTEDDGFRVIDDERMSVAEFERRVNLLEDIRAQLPNDSISEIDDGILSVIIVKDEAEYELSVKVTQQLFAGQKLIDIFQLSSKDNAVARRATNIPAIIDVINSL